MSQQKDTDMRTMRGVHTENIAETPFVTLFKRFINNRINIPIKSALVFSHRSIAKSSTDYINIQTLLMSYLLTEVTL